MSMYLFMVILSDVDAAVMLGDTRRTACRAATLATPGRPTERVEKVDPHVGSGRIAVGPRLAGHVDVLVHDETLSPMTS